MLKKPNFHKRREVQYFNIQADIRMKTLVKIFIAICSDPRQ